MGWCGACCPKTLARAATVAGRSWRRVLAVLAPIALCPLLIVYDSKETRCAYAILLMAVYWMFELVHLSVTSLLPVFLFPVLGILDTASTTAPYMKWTPYADIVLELTAHFTPCLSVIVQCFAFHKCSQQPGESISNFVPAPRRFSEHCNFGETLSAMLWDRLVCGVLDKRVQRRPLGKPVLELKKAFEAADPLPL
ncbi:hypothetical protein ISCGN_007765 [Ixodes scapularis]